MPHHLTRAIGLAKLVTAIGLIALFASCGSSVNAAADDSQQSAAVDGDHPSTDPATDEVEDDHEHVDEGHAEESDHDRDDEDEAATVSNESSDDGGIAVPVANADYLGSYTLIDESFGTQATVVVDRDTRTIESNTLPNHETGDFPNAGNPNTISEQDRAWTLTTNPAFTGWATPVRETGVALNGVKFEPGTAESVECSTGETYRIEGLQDMFDLGMDFNNAHVQPTGEYHYHGVSELLVDAFASDEDLVLVGFAADGHLMYYSKSNAYQASYSLSISKRSGTDCSYRTGAVDIDGTSPDGTYVSDWQYIEGQGDLDQCNGTMIGGEYAYVITEQYPYVSRCLMGEVAETVPGGGGGAAPADGEAPPVGEAPAGVDQGGAPDLSEAAEALGLAEQELQVLLGGPPPDVGAAAEALGMTEDNLMALLESFGVAPPAA